MRIVLIVLLSSLAVVLDAQENLESKIVRLALNQNEPAVIKVGSHGITTIEFPTKIEALDGFGFSVNPAPDGPDLFQISFNKGTNFLSLKAVRPGVEGNLTVVLDGKVYSLYCKEAADPSFVVIFEDGLGRSSGTPPDLMARTKVASPARLVGFLDKLKGFPTLRSSAPEIFQNIDFAEPDSHSGLDSVDVILRRVIRDDALDSVGFEIQLVNKSETDFFYDPEGFAVRVRDEVYAQSISDAGGMVPAGKTETAFFVVTGRATGGRNDLAVTNKFEIVSLPVLNYSHIFGTVPRKTALVKELQPIDGEKYGTIRNSSEPKKWRRSGEVSGQPFPGRCPLLAGQGFQEALRPGRRT
jgi:hypothetical protein